jgi:hypothetical protein
VAFSKLPMPKVAKLLMWFKENTEIFKDGTVKGCVVGIRCPDQLKDECPPPPRFGKDPPERL